MGKWCNPLLPLRIAALVIRELLGFEEGVGERPPQMAAIYVNGTPLSKTRSSSSLSRCQRSG